MNNRTEKSVAEKIESKEELIKNLKVVLAQLKKLEYMKNPSHRETAFALTVKLSKNPPQLPSLPSQITVYKKQFITNSITFHTKLLKKLENELIALKDPRLVILDAVSSTIKQLAKNKTTRQTFSDVLKINHLSHAELVKLESETLPTKVIITSELKRLNDQLTLRPMQASIQINIINSMIITGNGKEIIIKKALIENLIATIQLKEFIDVSLLRISQKYFFKNPKHLKGTHTKEFSYPVARELNNLLIPLTPERRLTLFNLNESYDDFLMFKKQEINIKTKVMQLLPELTYDETLELVAFLKKIRPQIISFCEKAYQSIAEINIAPVELLDWQKQTLDFIKTEIRKHPQFSSNVLFRINVKIELSLIEQAFNNPALYNADYDSLAEASMQDIVLTDFLESLSLNQSEVVTNISAKPKYDPSLQGLFHACEAGDYPAVASLIGIFHLRNIINDACDKEGRNAFYIAVANNHTSVVKLMIAKPYVNMDAVDAQGIPAYEIASKKIKDVIDAQRRLNEAKKIVPTPYSQPISLAKSSPVAAIVEEQADHSIDYFNNFVSSQEITTLLNSVTADYKNLSEQDEKLTPSEISTQIQDAGNKLNDLLNQERTCLDAARQLTHSKKGTNPNPDLTTLRNLRKSHSKIIKSMSNIKRILSDIEIRLLNIKTIIEENNREAASISSNQLTVTPGNQSHTTFFRTARAEQTTITVGARTERQNPSLA